MGERNDDARTRNLALIALSGLLVLAIAGASVRKYLERRAHAQEEAAADAGANAARLASSLPLRAGYFPSVTLRGPDGLQTLPSTEATVVHIWLQGCQDCMPAFEAVRDGERCRGRVVNIAFGEATPSWAAQYGVRTNLVFDPNGARVVRPLGISSFTTMVVAPSGEILVGDRPGSPTYRAALAPYCSNP